MEVDTRKMNSENVREMSFSGAARKLLDGMQPGDKVEVTSVIDAFGTKHEASRLRIFIQQQKKSSEKIMTRNINGSLHIWRIA